MNPAAHIAFYYIATFFAVLTALFAWIPFVNPAPPATPWPGWSWRFFTIFLLAYLVAYWPK